MQGKCCNAGKNGWLFGRHFNGDERGWLPSAAVGEVATTKHGYISLKRGEEICVEHLGYIALHCLDMNAGEGALLPVTKHARELEMAFFQPHP